MERLTIIESSGGSEEQRFPPLGPRLRALMVWPRFPRSFWGLEGMLEMLPENAIMPPLGLITVAALCPPSWEIRLVDRAFEDLRDEQILWADLVMVSAMYVQREDAHAILARARALGKRTIIGGAYASSQPETVAALADHVVVGEPDEVFDSIAAGLESGEARSIYRIEEKPDITHTPVPRFDLLDFSRYASISVQFSRGCPFQCEFCDIITIYGRRPRTKSPSQVIAELDIIRQAGWRKKVFIVDDNFIGNHRKALELAVELEKWQDRHRRPFIFYTEASIDLAQKIELLDAMVRANFFYVFIGIETPSEESLRETRKYQNLRIDPLEAVHFIQRRGLWVTAGFIVGFDSDREDIFDRQIRFIEQAAIPWAMAGLLQAPPTTPLFDRMMAEGRMNLASEATSNFSAPNFETRMPLDTLLAGMRRTLLSIYSPDAFFERTLRSLYYWRPRDPQRAPPISMLYRIRAVAQSTWRQGCVSAYRRVYWRFLIRLLWLWGRDFRKVWLGYVIAMSGHHFTAYSNEIAAAMEEARERSWPAARSAVT
jgi:radical SAM superfamily enzyme YgiQ (UPF0313 family)